MSGRHVWHYTFRRVEPGWRRVKEPARLQGQASGSSVNVKHGFAVSAKDLLYREVNSSAALRSPFVLCFSLPGQEWPGQCMSLWYPVPGR